MRAGLMVAPASWFCCMCLLVLLICRKGFRVTSGPGAEGLFFPLIANIHEFQILFGGITGALVHFVKFDC
jgi:hypothetical protein